MELTVTLGLDFHLRWFSKEKASALNHMVADLVSSCFDSRESTHLNLLSRAAVQSGEPAGSQICKEVLCVRGCCASIFLRSLILSGLLCALGGQGFPRSFDSLQEVLGWGVLVPSVSGFCRCPFLCYTEIVFLLGSDFWITNYECSMVDFAILVFSLQFGFLVMFCFRLWIHCRTRNWCCMYPLPCAAPFRNGIDDLSVC
jgi:hypothetical protein